jgi:hypothetical protein
MRGYPSSISLHSLTMIRCGTSCWFPCWPAHDAEHTDRHRPARLKRWVSGYIGPRGAPLVPYRRFITAVLPALLHPSFTYLACGRYHIPSRLNVDCQRASLTDFFRLSYSTQDFLVCTHSPVSDGFWVVEPCQTDSSSTHWPPVHAQLSSFIQICCNGRLAFSMITTLIMYRASLIHQFQTTQSLPLLPPYKIS